MKIRVITSKDDISCVCPTDSMVHFAFRPSAANIFSLVNACPKVECIQIPPSYMVNFSVSMRTYLKMQRIKLSEGDVWGHRSDRGQYYEVPKNILERVNNLRRTGFPDDEIVKNIKMTYPRFGCNAEFIVANC